MSYNCQFCDRSLGNKGSLTVHERACDTNPNKVFTPRLGSGQKKGCKSWNKGLTFEMDKLNRLLFAIESGEYKTKSEYHIRKLVRHYLIHKIGYGCMICGLKEWRNHPIPLVCDHIDGDSTNNDINNFRIICNNCDSIQPTFQGKNRGAGRKDRYKTVDLNTKTE